METLTQLQMEALSPGQEQGTLVGLLLAGVLYCFLGYRVFRFLLGLTGFLLAGAVAGALAGWLTYGHVVTMGIAGLVGGVCGAVALLFLYRLGVFFIGFLGGLIIAYHVLQGRPEPWIIWAILGSGCVGGVMALGLEPLVMTVATSVDRRMAVHGVGILSGVGHGLWPGPVEAGEYSGGFVGIVDCLGGAGSPWYSGPVPFWESAGQKIGRENVICGG